MKIKERLASWGETGAKIWSAYWLVIMGGLLVVGSVVLKWIEFPFSRNIKGVSLPLFRSPGLPPHITPFSFGAVAVGILLLALLLRRFYPLALSLAAAFLLTLWLITPEHIAFRQPSLLRRLNNELDALPTIRAFTKDYLPENYGAPEALPKRLDLSTAWGRFVGAWSFLRFGWYCFGIGSVLITIHVFNSSRNGRSLKSVVIFGLPAAAYIIILIPALIGQHYLTNAALTKARGLNEQAIAAYRKAMRWDGWHAQDIDLYATIGELQALAGLAEDSPERHISQAEKLLVERNYDSGIYELGLASRAKGRVGDAARREAARFHLNFGLALYGNGGVGAAVTSWEQGLQKDPSQVYILPYLARGYFDLGNYPQTIATVERLAKIVADHNSLLGDAYSLAGDAYAKLGKTEEARTYYYKSYMADPIDNYWALAALVGE